MAPWSPFVWRSYKMKRVVSSTLAAETQSILNALGHAEWIAVHLAEMLCYNFAVDRRLEAIHCVRLLCLVDAKSLYVQLSVVPICSLPGNADEVRSHDTVGSYKQRVGRCLYKALGRCSERVAIVSQTKVNVVVTRTNHVRPSGRKKRTENTSTSITSCQLSVIVFFVIT